MQWGGFGSGFSQGFMQGVQLYKTVDSLKQQKEVKDLRAKGMAEAQAAREKDANGMIKDGGITGEPAKAPDAPKTGETAPDTATTKTSAVGQPATKVITPNAEASAPQPPVQDPLTADQPAVPAAPVTPPTAAQKTPSVAAGGMTPPTPKPVEIAPITVKSPPPTAATPGTAAPGTDVAPTAKATSTAPPAAAGAGFKRFRVGDASFDTREEALAHARKQVPSATDYFMKNAVPAISAKYLEQGDVEKAEAWDKYAKDKATQRNMETWAKMARSAQSGDFDAAANHAFELYKSYDDGVTPLSKETVKDKDGNVTGFNVKLKVDATGETRTQFIGSREIVEMGLGALSPQGMFDAMYKRQQSADQARAKAAADAANDQRTLNRELTVQAVRDKAADARQDRGFVQQKEMKTQEGQQALDRIEFTEQVKAANLGKAEEAKANAKIKGLKSAGYTDDAINGMMPQILGVGDHKKTTDPTERRALVFDNLMKNDRAFAMEKDPAKREAKVNEAMGVIYGAPAGGSATPGGATPKAVPNPAAGGMPAKPLLFKGDDGKVYKIEGGRYVPVSQ
jgi:hypothetical protein